jgi:ABC-type phosphate transport system substrate-binding protein
MQTAMARVLAIAAVALLARTAEAQGSRFVIVVNPKNPVVRLSPAEITRIYLGKLQAWDIDGKLQPVAPVDQKATSPLRVAFSRNLLRRSVNETTSYWRQEVFAGRNVPPPEQTEKEALETVRNVVGGIAYVSATADLRGVKVVSVR